MKPIDTRGISPSPRVETDRRTGGAQVESGGAQSTERRGGVLADDSVELTDTASRLSQLSREIQAADGVDIERVEAIRQRLADGSYEIDAGRIADALIQQERELG